MLGIDVFFERRWFLQPLEPFPRVIKAFYSWEHFLLSLRMLLST